MGLITQIYNSNTKTELKFQKENMCLETKILKRILKIFSLKLITYTSYLVQQRENCPNLQL